MSAATRFLTLSLGLATASLVWGCDGTTDMATIFGVGEGQNMIETPPPTPRPTPKPTPIPTPKPGVTAMPAVQKRNIAFDKVRSNGIAQVFEGRTKLAVATFQAAQRIKPDDLSLKLWLGTLEKANELARKAAAKDYTLPGQETGSANVQGGAPASVSPANGAPGGASAQPVLPKRPAVPLPSVDPNLVF